MKVRMPRNTTNIHNERTSFVEKIIQKMNGNRVTNTTDIDNDEIIEIEEEGL